VIVIGRAAYAATIWSWEIVQGSTGQSGPIVTVPASVPVTSPVSGCGVPVFSRMATAIVITISTMMKRERLRSIPGIVDG
jgi:hypothetical protein